MGNCCFCTMPYNNLYKYFKYLFGSSQRHHYAYSDRRYSTFFIYLERTKWILQYIAEFNWFG